MAIKKKVKKRFAVKKSVPVSRSNDNEGFFQRMKEIIKSEMPKPEKVRVKTFIVEKPVIIHDKAQKYNSDEDDVYDSKKSRYSHGSISNEMNLIRQKKKTVKEDDFDQEPAQEDEFAEGESSEELDAQGEENLGEQEIGDDSELSEEAPIEGEDDLGEDVPAEAATLTHTRSRGMFNNIWWKKALFWAILTWLFILAISMAMFAMKLITVNFERQWWVLLAIIILVEMIYFKFFEGKLKI